MRSVLAVPEDDAPRLVVADWLEENGQPERAEFIRLQIDAHRRTGGRGFESLIHVPATSTARQQAILKTHWKQWMRPLRRTPLMGRPLRYRRGFLELLTDSPSVLDEIGEYLFAALPVLQFQAIVRDDADANFLGTTWLARIRELILISTERGRGDRALAAVAESPHCGRMRELSLQNIYPRTETVRALAASPLLGRLETLNISSVFPGAGGDITSALRSTGVAGLRHLLGGYTLGSAEALDNLLASPCRASLESLTITVPRDVIEVNIARLAERPWPRLEALLLCVPNAPDGSWQALLQSDAFPSLRRLDLAQSGVGDGGLKALLAGPIPARLEGLGLRGNALTDDGLIALAHCDALKHLAVLDLASNDLTYRGVRALLDAERLAGLVSLSCRGQRSLTHAPTRSRLRERFGADAWY